MSSFLDRVASAPISWGICEVPGWGEMLPTDRVLSEMAALGFTATELGAPGFLPADPQGVKTQLGEHGMTLLGGFVPVVLHDPAARDRAVADVISAAQMFQGAGGSTFVTAIVLEQSWPVPRQLDGVERAHLIEMLTVIDGICAEHALEQVIHPHVWTQVETKADVDWILESSGTHWTLDTGHLAIGGVDPVAFARDHADRIGHVHLKDVNLELAPAVMRREKSLMQATQEGLFTPLGEGDVDLAGVIRTLEAGGYQGWYVIEQDTALTGGLPAEGSGPIEAMRTSLRFLTEAVAPTLA